ncbi:MAG: hypothetical protein HY833_01465 [Candidatus Aenigmarchaeota archaeon]|nr:hypothetical protein [Candidatus Aenigmarchaeota archaeon]
MSELSFSKTNEQRAMLDSNQRIVDKILNYAETLDFINIQILRKFYATGLAFPNDTQPHVFSLLYMDMKNVHRIPIGMEALRKRVDFLVSIGLLEKVERSNPASYHPVKGLEQSARAVIKRFMMNHGLTHI